MASEMTRGVTPGINSQDSVLPGEPLDPLFEMFPKEDFFGSTLVPSDVPDVDQTMMNWILNPDDINLEINDFSL